MLRDSACVGEIELSKMGLSDASSSSLQVPRTHNPNRRASEGMIDIRRGILPPLPNNKNSSVNVLNGPMAKLSVSPVVTMVVNDDETMPSSSQRVFRRRGSSPWSKTTMSSSSSPQSLPSASNPTGILAPSPPPWSISPCASPKNFSQARNRRYRRGSLPASTLSPTSPKMFTDWKNEFSIPIQNSHKQSSNETDRVDQNSNVLQRESLSQSLLSKPRSLSPYPQSSRSAALRRRSDGAIHSQAGHNQGEKSSSCNRSRTIMDTQNKISSSKITNDDQRQRHRKSISAEVVEETRHETRRIDRQPVNHDRGFAPITKNEQMVGDDNDSTVYDFDDDQDDEARQWILNWLDGVEKSSEKTPAVALDDLCRYSGSRETAINVYYDGKET